MDVFDYLEKYKNTPFKEKHFNEVDALIIAVLSYVPYGELGFKKNKANAKEMHKFAKEWKPPFNASARKVKYIDLLRIAKDMRMQHLLSLKKKEMKLETSNFKPFAS